jgi:hypothetical protein
MRFLSPPRVITSSIAVVCALGVGELTTTQGGIYPIGIVNTVVGGWTRFPSREPLVRGQLVYAEQAITIGRSVSGSISILLFADGATWRKDCSEQVPCAGPYRPTSPKADERVAQPRRRPTSAGSGLFSQVSGSPDSSFRPW